MFKRSLLWSLIVSIFLTLHLQAFHLTRFGAGGKLQTNGNSKLKFNHIHFAKLSVGEVVAAEVDFVGGSSKDQKIFFSVCRYTKYHFFDK
jgi:hypothetical protein